MPTQLSRSPALVGVLVVLVLGGAAFAGWYVFVRDTPPVKLDPPPVAADSPDPELTPDPPPPDPRLTFPTPFRNVRPGVKYLGDASCTGCHGDIDRAYHAHPMGRSTEPTARASQLERYDSAARNPFTAGPYELRVEKTPTGVVHHVRAKDSDGNPLPEYVVTADLAIGSGTRGRSYLTLEHGAAWETPISWFTHGARWDVSPGFDLGNGGRRAIGTDCLYCHINQADTLPGATNRYREPMLTVQTSIGCERCHGPGELHVAERKTGQGHAGVDTSIVNPKHLAPDLRAAICAQCHLQGQERILRRGRELAEFRPGLPLDLFLTVFVRHPDLVDARRSVGQFEQMERSKCFTASKGQLGCTTCHDPHTMPTLVTRDAFYRGRCATCHNPAANRECSAPLADRTAKADSCTACHMPRGDSSNIAHASVTDHRIPRRPAPEPPPRGLPPGAVPLVPFPTGPHQPPAAEQERDLGIALARAAVRVPAAAAGVRAVVADLAINRLTAAQTHWPGDAPARLALSLARGARGDSAGRLTAAMAAARLAPESDAARAELAEAATVAGRFDVAVDAATWLAGRNPTAIEPLLLRATAYLRARDWVKAEADCRAALRIHPLHPQTRMLLAICLHNRGDPSAGRREALTAAGLTTNPQQQAALLEWFGRDTR